MSTTLVDMAKVTQLLDVGWTVSLFKNSLGSYTARARKFRGLKNLLTAETVLVETDDFTPEQALTRLAYKTVDNVIL